MFLCSAELFLGHAHLHSPDSFRGVITGCTDEFREMVSWVAKTKHSQDAVVVSDGRSEVARKQIREVLASTVGDDFLELWVIYEMETSLHKDVRNPQRKIAWSSNQGAEGPRLSRFVYELWRGNKLQPELHRGAFSKSC